MNRFWCFSRRGRPSSAEKSHDSSSTDDVFTDEGASYQRDQWQLVLAENRKAMLQALDHPTRARSKPVGIAPGDLLDSLTDGKLTAEHCLQQVSAMYNQNKFAQRMPRILAIFTGLQPFTAAVTTLAQTNIASALVWGSLALVFQVCDHQRLFNV